MQLKRKGLDDGAIVDANFPKRPRQEFELPTILEDSMSVVPEVCPVEVPNDTPILDIASTPATLVITEPDSEDRAIVLYKPMSSSAYQQLQVTSASFPQNIKGFQIPNGWSQALKQKLGYSLEDATSSNRLAVVPYSAPTTIIVNEDGSISGLAGARPRSGSYSGSVIIEDITDQVRQEEEDAMQVEETAAAAAPMELEGEDMAVDAMQDLTPAAAPTSPFVAAPPQFAAAPQFNASSPTWQMHHSPPYTPVMWSSG